MQTYDASTQPRLARPIGQTATAPGTPQTRAPYSNTMPQSPGIVGPGLPDYEAARTRARALNTNLYSNQDIRRAGSTAQTRGNAVARNQMNQFLARGGSMGGGAAALLGGSLYGAAAMAGNDASRAADFDNRRGRMEGEFRREGILGSIDAAQQAAALGSTSLNQSAANANRNFDYDVYADDRRMSLDERRVASDEAERRRLAAQDDWRFQNEQRAYPYSPQNPYSPNSPMNPMNPSNASFYPPGTSPYSRVPSPAYGPPRDIFESRF